MRRIRPDRLRSLDALLADLWALRRVCLQRVQLPSDDQGVQQPPALLSVLNVIGSTIERVSAAISHSFIGITTNGCGLDLYVRRYGARDELATRKKLL
jgi:hypothetical protein